MPRDGAPVTRSPPWQTTSRPGPMLHNLLWGAPSRAPKQVIHTLLEARAVARPKASWAPWCTTCAVPTMAGWTTYRTATLARSQQGFHHGCWATYNTATVACIQQAARHGAHPRGWLSWPCTLFSCCTTSFWPCFMSYANVKDCCIRLFSLGH